MYMYMYVYLPPSFPLFPGLMITLEMYSDILEKVH